MFVVLDLVKGVLKVWCAGFFYIPNVYLFILTFNFKLNNCFFYLPNYYSVVIYYVNWLQIHISISDSSDEYETITMQSENIVIKNYD